MSAVKIGPTFSSELASAGLFGLSMSWGDDGTFSFDSSVTKSQIDAVMTVFAAHNPSLSQARYDQITIIEQAYQAAIYADIAFTTAAGVAQTFQGDAGSQAILVQSKSRYNETGVTPNGFFWLSKDNTQVAFTFADLVGLYNAMFDRGQLAFAKKTQLKASIRTATDVASVQAVVW